MLSDFANHNLLQRNEIKARTSRSDLLDFMVVNGILGQGYCPFILPTWELISLLSDLRDKTLLEISHVTIHASTLIAEQMLWLADAEVCIIYTALK